jgi:hypothetical protein
VAFTWTLADGELRRSGRGAELVSQVNISGDTMTSTFESDGFQVTHTFRRR